MANWKKLIVSGSDAHLASVTASNGAVISGPLLVSGSSTFSAVDTLILTGSSLISGSSVITGSLSITGSIFVKDLSSNNLSKFVVYDDTTGQFYYNTAGAAGSSGTSGASGTSGSSGTSGANGTSGTSGESGTSGTSGESGTSGTSGESGTSGTGFNTINNAGNGRLLLSDGTPNAATASSDLTFSGSILLVTGSSVISGSSNVLTVIGNGTNLLSVSSSTGEVFNISQLTTGSLLEIIEPSGSIVLEVNTDFNFRFGSGSIYVKNTVFDKSISSGSTLLYSMPTGSYNAMYIDYRVKKNTNIRAGTFTTVWIASNIVNTEYSTVDIGDTSPVNLTSILNSDSLEIKAQSSENDWIITGIIRVV